MTPFSGSQSVRLHTHLFYLSFLVSRFLFLLLSLSFRGLNCLETETIAARAGLIAELHQDAGGSESCDGRELPPYHYSQHLPLLRAHLFLFHHSKLLLLQEQAPSPESRIRSSDPASSLFRELFRFLNPFKR